MTIQTTQRADAPQAESAVEGEPLLAALNLANVNRMSVNDWAIHLSAPLAVIAGLLSCFWGYQLMKLTVGLIGFVAGAGGGWSIGLTWAPHNELVALICALIAGVLCAMLCIWLFYMGIFVMGASAGAVIAAAVLNATGRAVQPLSVLLAASVFGLIALVMQKFMIIVSTAFSGSYLITAALVHLWTGKEKLPPLWFAPGEGNSGTTLGYAALGLWLLVGLIGIRFQYRGKARDKAPRQEEKPA